MGGGTLPNKNLPLNHWLDGTKLRKLLACFTFYIKYIDLECVSLNFKLTLFHIYDWELIKMLL